MIFIVAIVLFVIFLAFLCSGGDTPSSPNIKYSNTAKYTCTKEEIEYLRKNLFK
jgi:hypothetical protein